MRNLLSNTFKWLTAAVDNVLKSCLWNQKYNGWKTTYKLIGSYEASKEITATSKKVVGSVKKIKR